MTSHLETAIRDAVEKGGYSHPLAGKAIMMFSKGIPFNDYGLPPWFVLDHAFWRALGKARGWGKEHQFGCSANMVYGSCDCVLDMKWEAEWHRLIDHLIAGGDAETFFASLMCDKTTE